MNRLGSAPSSFGGQYASKEHAAGSSGAAIKTLDWNEGNCQSVSMTGNCTFAFSNPLPGARYLLRLTGDGVLVRAPVWPASVVWSGGAAPTLSGAAKSDLIAIYYTGANYLCGVQPNFAAVT